MVPTNPPELPKPSRTPGEKQKPEFLNPTFYRKYKNDIFLINPFLGPICFEFLSFFLFAAERLAQAWARWPLSAYCHSVLLQAIHCLPSRPDIGPLDGYWVHQALQPHEPRAIQTG